MAERSVLKRRALWIGGRVNGGNSLPGSPRQKAPATPPLAREHRILDVFARDLARSGLAGEERAGSLLYLAITSRLLAHPTSILVTGPSSSGKSHLVEKVLDFFPASAFHALSAMSERALAYLSEPLKHRVLVITEAAAFDGAVMASYLIRTLLSEGRIRYQTVVQGEHGPYARTLQLDGPTGLVMTTTSLRLHPENETRMFSVPITDTPEQTRGVLRAIALEGERPPVDLQPWHGLQEFLASDPQRDVSIPFAEQLAEQIPDSLGLRIRRDFGSLLTLVRAHALLHRRSREEDDFGRVIAHQDDYAVVHGLVADLIATSHEAVVKPEVVAVIDALEALGASGVPVEGHQVASHLGVHKTTASRRISEAVALGYVRNLSRPGRAQRLVPGDPLPTAVDLLPPPEAIRSPGSVEL